MLWIAILWITMQPPDAPETKQDAPPSKNGTTTTAAAAQPQIVAELAGKTAAIENLHTEVLKAKEETRTAIAKGETENIYSLIKAIIGSVAGSAVTIGMAAKWWLDWRSKQKDKEAAIDAKRKDDEHKNEIEKLTLEHANAVEMARVQAENKKTENGTELEQLRKDFDRLEKQCAEDEKKCEDRLNELKSLWIGADAKAESLRERVDGQQKQIIHLQTWSKDFPFASVASDRDYRILNVTGNADRNILYPMGLTREKVELKLEDDIWPKEFVDLLKLLREAAATKPGHCAAVIGARFHKSLPPFIVAKILGQDPSGAAWGVQTVFIPMTAVIDLPPRFADEPDAP